MSTSSMQHQKHRRGLAWDSHCTSCVDLLTGAVPGAERGYATVSNMKNYPMLKERSRAVNQQDYPELVQVAFTQATYAWVRYEECARWRRLKKEKLKQEMLYRWTLARMVRDAPERIAFSLL